MSMRDSKQSDLKEREKNTKAAYRPQEAHIFRCECRYIENINYL